MIVLVLRKVTNAADRKADRVYVRRIRVAARPNIGDRITTNVFGRSIEVEEIEHRDGELLVWLKKDHRTFKAPESFPSMCEDYERRGWASRLGE